MPRAFLVCGSECYTVSMMLFYNFIQTSNLIEGIDRAVTPEEFYAHDTIMRLEEITLADIAAFIGIIQPDARLRSTPDLNVQVHNHVAPLGGPQVVDEMMRIIREVEDPFEFHRRYLTLHPWTDGNGRSARVLWLWKMSRINDLKEILQTSFLLHWYWQSLQNGDKIYAV